MPGRIHIRIYTRYIHKILILAIFVINGEYSEMKVNLFDPNGNTVYSKEGQSFVKLAFTATETGNHQVCIENYGSSPSKVNFEFLSGVAAKDYSAIAKKSNLKPIELNVNFITMIFFKIATKIRRHDVIFNSRT